MTTFQITPLFGRFYTKQFVADRFGLAQIQRLQTHESVPPKNFKTAVKIHFLDALASLRPRIATDNLRIQ